MKWSKYNKLFYSKKYGWLLYNAVSNTFLRIEEKYYPEISKLIKAPEKYKFEEDPALYFILRLNGFLVENGDDEAHRNFIKMLRYQNNYNSSYMTLTIAPTRDCNFDCIYCYEEHKPPIYMKEEIEDKLVNFVKRSGVQHLGVVWFGGEPLLAFNTILSLTEKFQKLNIVYDGAMIITNGYLLDKKKIDALSDLKVTHLQITLDGPKEVHDRRRPLKSGKGTFDKIVNNMDYLFSHWNGKVYLRVNVDHTNKDNFHEIYRWLIERYKDIFIQKRLLIYPGIVHGEGDPTLPVNCMRDRDEEAKFVIEQYKKYGITGLQFYPKRFFSGCAAIRKNAFLVDPEGNLYKCWEDLGIKEKIVGHIDPNKPWNNKLLANYMIKGSYLEDEVCNECFLFPICEGGCPRVRLIKGNEKKDQLCTYFKNHLEEFLEIYYEIKNNLSE